MTNNTTAFDLDAWLNDIAPAQQTVRIYARGDLADRDEALRNRIVIAERRTRQLADDDETGGSDAAMGDDPGIEDVEALKAERAALRDDLEASGHDFVLKGITQRVQDRIVDESTDDTGKIDGAELTFRSLAASMGCERSTVDSLADRLSVGEFARLVNAMREVTQGVVELPLS